MTTKHILVTGAHRSGTTWVGRTISLAPELKYIHEPFNVDHPNAEVGFRARKWFLDAAASPQKEEIEVAFRKVFAVEQQKLVIKDPLSLLSAGWLYEKFDLKVVCMIRNPLAFAGSIKKFQWTFGFRHFFEQKELMRDRLLPLANEIDAFSRDSHDIIEQACLLWNILHLIIIQYQRKYPSWLFVKHEQLACRPLEWFQKIFDYVNIKMDEKIRTNIEDFTSDKNPADVAKIDFVRRNAKASLYTWKARLTTSEIETVIARTRKIAVNFYPDFPDMAFCEVLPSNLLA